MNLYIDRALAPGCLECRVRSRSKHCLFKTTHSENPSMNYRRQVDTHSHFANICTYVYLNVKNVNARSMGNDTKTRPSGNARLKQQTTRRSEPIDRTAEINECLRCELVAGAFSPFHLFMGSADNFGSAADLKTLGAEPRKAPSFRSR